MAKLYPTDFVIINKETKEPIEPLDVIYSSLSLAEFLNSGEYQVKPESNYEFVSMTELSKELQNRYLQAMRGVER